MSQLHYTTKSKFKHLNFQHYEYIQQEYNHFIKCVKSNKTIFMKQLASDLGTSLSNLYNIIKVGTIEINNYNLTTREEFSARVAFENRRPTIPNNLKLNEINDFLTILYSRFFDKKSIDGIDEIVNSTIIDNPNIKTVSTKTIYNYINKGYIKIKRFNLPFANRRKCKTIKKVAKRHKGTSIEHRDDEINNRHEFGHWEGDLVVGGRTGQTGAILTLIERKTRHLISFKINSKSAKQVYMAINSLERLYGTDMFTKIFKSITFDNGSEFSRFEDIETSVLDKTIQRTKVFFAHPYASYERGSNENCNGLLRRFFPKGTNFLKISKEHIEQATISINEKRRKINNYLPSNKLFQSELNHL